MTSLGLRIFLVLVTLGLMTGSASATDSDGAVFTFWPLIDYRRSEAAEYTSVNVLGPIFKFEKKAGESEFGFRPFYFRATDTKGVTYSEYLYPIGARKGQPDQSSLQVIQLYQHDFGPEAHKRESEFFLFPLVFYGNVPEKGEYFALFPLGGKIYDKFGRDQITFTLFPLFGQTQKKGTTINNILWPVYARIYGEDERGLKLWPLWGAAEKKGVYRKRFALWPIFYSQELALNTDNPRHRRGAFPFYLAMDSPKESSRAWLWPFFSHIENREKGFEQWNFPWPLFRVTRGERREGDSYLPFYADERVGERRKRWFLWPIYKIEEIHSEIIDRRRDRILYFLFSNLEETVIEEGTPRKKRVALWPLFTYERVKGVAHFYTLSLLEPFFPERPGIERNWSPLWRLYQRKWDEHGNEISSFLWNLYWREKRGEDLAMGVFPFFTYERKAGRGVDFSLFKGLFHYRREGVARGMKLFYLPWEVPLGGETGGGPGAGTE